MTEAWRIDSLDARAGIAFGSWRLADLISGDVDLERAAVFLAPPYFRPEALSNRAMGLSASRGQGQLGVFVGGDELAFETLDALSEFVRRVYQTGGGGDLPGGGGAGGRPRPPDGEPEGGGPDIGGTELDVPTEGIGGARSVAEAAKRARDIAKSGLQFKPGKPIQSKATGPAEWGEARALSGGADDSLVMGAQELLIELIRRFPIQGGRTDILRWSEGGNRLGDAISRLGRWYKVLDGPARELLDRAIIQIGSKLSLVVGDRLGLIPLLTQRGVSLWRYDDRFLLVHGGYRSDNDPVDDLCAWPLPRDVAALIKSAVPDPSAFHLMGAICGSPTKLADALTNSAVRAASILLFSAAHIVVEITPPIGNVWADNELHNEALKASTVVSREWLVQQWPAMMFPQEVENVIGATALLAA